MLSLLVLPLVLDGNESGGCAPIRVYKQPRARSLAAVSCKQPRARARARLAAVPALARGCAHAASCAPSTESAVDRYSQINIHVLVRLVYSI